MEKLCSSDLNDVKKLLDLTAKDYSMNEFSYLPCIATSPFMLASGQINAYLTDNNHVMNTPASAYFVLWVFVVVKKDKYNSLTLPRHDNLVQQALLFVVDQMKDNSEGTFYAQKLLENLSFYIDSHHGVFSDIDHILVKVAYAEVLQKL